jgi:hypothetical protein
MRYDERAFPRFAMKAHRAVVGLLVLLFCACALVLLPPIPNNHTVYVTAESESVFLQSYSPQSVVEPFLNKEAISQWFHNMGGEGGDEFVTHRGGFQAEVSIPTKDRALLMTALSENLSSELTRDGAQIVGRNGDPHDGFRFDYKLGKSVGSVTISPLKVKGSSQQMPKKIKTVMLTIAIEERWYPKATTTVADLKSGEITQDRAGLL